MKNTRYLTVCVTGVTILLFAAATVLAAAGRGGGGGGGGGGGRGGGGGSSVGGRGFSGGGSSFGRGSAGGGWQGSGGSISSGRGSGASGFSGKGSGEAMSGGKGPGGSMSSGKGAGGSGFSGKGSGGAVSPGKGPGGSGPGQGGASVRSGTRGVGPSGNRTANLGPRAEGVDLMRSHGTREAASKPRHSWDKHFTHPKGPRDYPRGPHGHPGGSHGLPRGPHAGYPYYRHFYRFPSVFWFWPFWDPFWYSGFRAPYFARYVYCYDDAPYDWAFYSPVSTVASATVAEDEPPVANTAAEQPADDGQFSALQLYSGAREAFRTGDYRDALRLASHAAIEAPQNPKVHELASLALFALGDYRGAAIAAHAALAFGPPSDWPALAEHYGDPAEYTKQLRALEAYAGEHKSAADAQFLAGYHYLMIGAREEAKAQMAQAVKLTPKDELAAHVLKQLESGAAVTPPSAEPPKPQPGQPQPAKPQPAR